MKTSLRIVADKPTASGRIYPRAVCEDIIKQLNAQSPPIFIINSLSVEPDADIGKACGVVKTGSAGFDETDGITIQLQFFKKQIALAHPYDAIKYPSVGTFDGGKGNAVEQLAVEGGMQFSLVGGGSLDGNTVTDYKVMYIYAKPL